MTNYFYVRGVSFRQEEVDKCEASDAVLLEPEPDNKFDPNAIKVVLCKAEGHFHIGYVPRELTEYLREDPPFCPKIYYKGPTPDGGTVVQVSYLSDLPLPRQSKVKIPVDPDSNPVEK